MCGFLSSPPPPPPPPSPYYGEEDNPAFIEGGGDNGSPAIIIAVAAGASALAIGSLSVFLAYRFCKHRAPNAQPDAEQGNPPKAVQTPVQSNPQAISTA